MEEKYGKPIFSGIAIGKLRILEKKQIKITCMKIQNPQEEFERYIQAKDTALEQLNDLYEKARIQAGEDNAAIFSAHAMMLNDEDFTDSVRNLILNQEVNAEYAASVTGEDFAGIFENMEDEYFRARAADIRDITNRVICILSGRSTEQKLEEEPVILAAEDLAPSETVHMDKSRLLGFVTHLGSASSHTAILARTMGIPAITGVDIREQWDGKMAIVDGQEGKILIDPDSRTLKAYYDKKTENERQNLLLQDLIGKENRTRSGQEIQLFANIGSLEDLDAVLKNDAGGIGLFRSEFLYMESENYPSEETQFLVYKKVLETMGSKKVIIRTMDIGADKQLDYFKLEKEENPAMGYRAIRICLSQPEIFRTQLRALFRASVYGNLSILYPMIISCEEIRKIREISASVRKELREEGVPVETVEEGIMIETPAAALISDELARIVDFFSIGTNDLIQYTLAVDRQNSRLDSFYDPYHPAVLRLIQMVADNAHRAGIWVGICGELGADTSLTETFLKMGVDELSVSPGYILPVRKKIREAE